MPDRVLNDGMMMRIGLGRYGYNSLNDNMLYVGMYGK